MSTPVQPVHRGGHASEPVIPLDGSEFAARALPVAIELASAANAAVRVIGVAPTDAELAGTHDYVYDDAKRAGLDVCDVEVRVDPEPVNTHGPMVSRRRRAGTRPAPPLFA